MERKQQLKRNIKLYQALFALGRNGLTIATIYFLFTILKEFSVTQALFLIGLTSLSKGLSEVPTGVIADKISRKFSIVSGYLILSISWMGIILTGSFTSILIFTVIKGIGSSFVSGADDSLLYDSLQELGTAKKFKSIYNLSKSIDMVFFAVTTFLGGYLASINLLIPFVLQAILMLIAAGLTMFTVEPKLTQAGEEIETGSYLKHTSQTFKTIFSKSGLYKGIASAFLVFTFAGVMFKSIKNIMAPLLETYGLDISTIAFAVSAIILVKALGAFLASKYNKSGNEAKEIVIGLLIYICGLLVVILLDNLLIALAIFTLITLLDPVILTNLTTLINERISSKIRSTTLSLLSVFVELGKVVFLAGFGKFLDEYTQTAALAFALAWLVIALMISLFGNYLFNKQVAKPVPAAQVPPVLPVSET